MRAQTTGRRAALPQLGGLVLGVLLAHAWLAVQWPHGASQRLGFKLTPAPRAVLTLLPPAAARPSLAPAQAPSIPAPDIPPDRPPPRPTAQRGPAPGPAVVLAAAVKTPLPDLVATPSPAAADEPEAGDPTPGRPPPVYPTRLPAPTQLRYALSYHGQPGEALLAWRHDGQHYTLQLDGRGPAAAALVEQTSRGDIDSAGLAPERFVDRRRGRGWRAANFRRDIGRISASGGANASAGHPTWPGAQDRLSWLAQMAAIVAAAESPLPEITLFVVGARGAADLWRFQPNGEVLVHTPLGPLLAQHWRHEPLQPEGQRVQVWLDPARAHWPALLRFTSLRSGAVFELVLMAEPTP